MENLSIVSGGQTGADRAALDFAILSTIPHGGWCPRGRVAEDGAIPASYRLKETPEAHYDQRTEWNVRDSDGTVIFSIDPQLSGGSKTTADFAASHGKPMLHLYPGKSPAMDRDLLDFINVNSIRVLNVAGSRESKESGIYRFTLETLKSLL